MAYSLQFSLPGTPVLRYGEEIGMGDDLSLPGREAIRTPMQWSTGPTAGFSSAAPKDLVRPVVAAGPFGCDEVNVATPKGVLAHVAYGTESAVLFLHNLSPEDATVDLGPLPEQQGRPTEILADGDYPQPSEELTGLPLAGYGYRWIELARSYRP